MAENKYFNGAKDRMETVRLRTWTLTLAIIVTLVFYFLVTVTTKQTINPIDFVLVVVVQIVINSIYFPDGDLFGQKDPTYIANRDAYNESANEISLNKKIVRLREYCKIEFEERKKRYILTECSAIGIELNEYETLKGLSEEEIKNLKSYEFTQKDKKTNVVVFSKYKRKKLYNLLFKKLPVEKNYPETIMSAVENNGNHAVKDGSIQYKKHFYIRKVLMAIVIGGIFAYIGYTVRDGIGIAEITSISMYLTTIFTNAVMSFTGGETCSKVYKNNFYIGLTNFITGFFEWEKKVYKENE